VSGIVRKAPLGVRGWAVIGTETLLFMACPGLVWQVWAIVELRPARPLAPEGVRRTILLPNGCQSVISFLFL